MASHMQNTEEDKLASSNNSRALPLATAGKGSRGSSRTIIAVGDRLARSSSPRTVEAAETLVEMSMIDPSNDVGAKTHLVTLTSRQYRLIGAILRDAHSGTVIDIGKIGKEARYASKACAFDTVAHLWKSKFSNDASFSIRKTTKRERDTSGDAPLAKRKKTVKEVEELDGDKVVEKKSECEGKKPRKEVTASILPITTGTRKSSRISGILKAEKDNGLR